MKSRSTDNYTFLTTAPVGKVIVSMAVPTIISMLVTSLYNFIDTFYVGRISTQATAAVGVAFPVMTIIQAFGFFFGQGSGTFISRKLGAKELDEAKKMASTAFFESFVFGTVLAGLCLVFLEPLSRVLGATPTVIGDTKSFLGIILLGAPFLTASMTLNNQMRFQGNAAYAMIGVVSGAVLDVALVPLFAFTFGMGVAGAAVGTVIGQVAAFSILLLMSYKSEGIKLNIKDIAFTGHVHLEIFKGGTPSLSRQGLASVTTLLLNVAAGVYGDAAIAGMSIVSRISFVVFSFIIGLGQGFQPVCGFCYGAGLYDRVRKGYFFCVKAGIAFLLLCCIPGYVFADAIVDILRHDPEVVSVGMVALRWHILAYPLACVVTVSNMTLQTSGRAVSANIVAAARNGFFFLPLIIILPKMIGLSGVQLCQALADALSFALCVPFIWHYFRTIASAKICTGLRTE